MYIPIGILKLYINYSSIFQFIFFVGIFIMVMGTLANLYAIQQSFLTIKAAEKDIIEAKKIIVADSIVNELAKQQSIDKSMYIFINIL